MNASKAVVAKRPALRSVRLVPEDWATSWEARPREPVAIGLRTISDYEESVARREAAAQAEATTAGEIRPDEYNDALMAGVVAAAVCNPNDQTRDPAHIPTPAATLRQALTSRAIRRLFCEWEVMCADASPSAPHATDDDVEELLELLTDENLDLNDRARRFMAALLDELRGD